MEGKRRRQWERERKERRRLRRLWVARRLTALAVAGLTVYALFRLGAAMFSQPQARASEARSTEVQPPTELRFPSGSCQAVAGSAAEMDSKLAALRERFPDGAYWNHMGLEEEEWSCTTVTHTPCDHGAYGEAFCNSYGGATAQLFPQFGESNVQCLGFSSMLSDELFGRDAPISIHRSYDRLRVGDQIRLTSASHSMLVVKKTADAVQVAECNADYSTCRIDWDREISRKELEAYGEELEYMTRQGG